MAKKSKLETMKETIKKLEEFESTLTEEQLQVLHDGENYRQFMEKIDERQKEVMDCIANGYLRCDEKEMDELVDSVANVIKKFIKGDTRQKEVMDCIANGYLRCDEKKMDDYVMAVVKAINDFIDKDENKKNHSSSQKGKNEEIVGAKVGSTTTNSAPQYAQPAQQVTNNVGASAGYNSGQAAANSQPNLQGQTPNYSQTGYTQPTTLQYDAQ